jgi:hypothetical protein
MNDKMTDILGDLITTAAEADDLAFELMRTKTIVDLAAADGSLWANVNGLASRIFVATGMIRTTAIREDNPESEMLGGRLDTTSLIFAGALDSLVTLLGRVSGDAARAELEPFCARLRDMMVTTDRLRARGALRLREVGLL